jgi:Domain of unknown function (DUF1961)/Concanavalin A-like lectin/glucanases superfamily
VYADHLPLRRGNWYFVAVAWDKPSNTLTMYVNGRMVGRNNAAEDFASSGTTLYLGNPMMVMSDLRIQDTILDTEKIKQMYAAQRPSSNCLADADVAQVAGPVPLPALDVVRDSSWREAFACDFTQKSDLNQWAFQTGDLYRDRFKLEITKEGLYWRTPDIVAKESRGYLWCPTRFEGDQWIEYDFRLESPKGLALLIICAGGIQGEDIIEEHGLLNTGAMGPMLTRYRNYHWEYVRRVEAMRPDVETQYVHKNPWGKSLHVGCIPLLAQDTWHRLRWVKLGHRLHGSIDGKTVFDVTDTAWDNNGPVLNSGRVVLRQMYHTAMSYRGFSVYERT